MKLVYNVSDKPSWGKTVVFALQQLLAIMAATIVVPVIVNNWGYENGFLPQLSQSAALFGAGVGTLVYLLFTKFKSPVFLGSSFAFLSSMAAAFAGAASMAVGYLGLIIGAVLAGLVYVILAVLVKIFGTGWINRLMPPVVIGPTVAIIGLSLAGNAVGDVLTGSKVAGANSATLYVGLVCGLVTLFVTIGASIFGKKMSKMIPFIIGIGAGYAVAAIFTAISYAGDSAEFLALRVIDFGVFDTDWSKWYPDLTIVKVFQTENGGLDGFSGSYFLTLFAAYVPVAFVVFAEHIADHKNLSSIIEHDLLQDPGLHRTLLGDGVGSMAGALCGGACNTTYGESIGCVAISGNASVRTILVTACLAIALSFILPFSLFLSTIPSCVMGGVCIALYGFIAVSGLKMIKEVDLGENKNLFVVSTILICGVGGMSVSFGVNGEVTITSVAAALILGILVNLLVNSKFLKKKFEGGEAEEKTESKDEINK